MTVELAAADRVNLLHLFADCRYDRVLIDSVLEGVCGRAYADSRHQPRVARLDSGAFTMLGGDPTAPGVHALLAHAPIAYVTPQTPAWARLLQSAFRDSITVLSFTACQTDVLDPGHLATLCQTVPAGFELTRIDRALAANVTTEIGNPYFLEHFRSVDDFVARGIGYCIRHEGVMVSAATSMARSTQAIDVEIETIPRFQRRGLGTVVGARLVLACLEQGIAPCWLAGNPASERLALRLGYTRGTTYETYALP